jgi:hypothetical protein
MLLRKIKVLKKFNIKKNKKLDTFCLIKKSDWSLKIFESVGIFIKT